MTKQDSKTHRAETPASGGPGLGGDDIQELEKLRSRVEGQIKAELHPRVEWVSLRQGVTCPAQRQTAPAGAAGDRVACPMGSHTWFPGTTYEIEIDHASNGVVIAHKNDRARSLMVPMANVAEIMIRRTDES